jgi:peptide-methionine (S)-S-oxide reductase
MKKIAAFILAIISVSCQGAPKPITDEMVASAKENIKAQNPNNSTGNGKLETAIFAGGCFWCTEAFFTELKGVETVTSGYIGGTVPNPTYREVCTGTTGHAEAIKITFDPAQIAYEDLLQVFFETHDPTTLNRQGNDHGTQYRSEIFYTSEAQKKAAENFIKLLTDQKIYSDKVVTKVTKAPTFYEAEDYHQDYYALNKSQPYCQMVIAPKLDKLKKNYKSKLKN